MHLIRSASLLEKAVKQEFNILIADRNPHVREFLKREMTADGYRVQLAENARQLFKWIHHNEHLDLLIVDPDLPDMDVPSLLSQLREQFPLLPVVVHTLLTEKFDPSDRWSDFPFVEKQGGSIEVLKKLVFDILHKFHRKHH